MLTMACKVNPIACYPVCLPWLLPGDRLVSGNLALEKSDDGGQKSACRKFHQIGTGKRACRHVTPGLSANSDLDWSLSQCGAPFHLEV